MVYRYIYKITCTQDIWKNHFYIGKRTSEVKPENDNYKGSGTKIKEYYKQYPNDYIKEIICCCKDNEELCDKEKYIINKYLRHPLCLNLLEWSNGGKLTKKSRNKISKKLKGNHNTKGKIWVNNGIENRMIDKNEIDYYFSLGYKLGCIIKRG